MVLAPDSRAAAKKDRVAIVGGKVHTLAGRTYNPGIVLIEGDTITDVGGSELDVPHDYEEVDAANLEVYPGMIDSNTNLGLMEIELESATLDFNRNDDPVSPQVRAIDGINPGSELIPVNRLTGVTTVLASPGEDGIFTGQSAILDLDGDRVSRMVVKAPAGAHLSIGGGGGRLSKMAKIRELLLDAQEHKHSQEKHKTELKNFELEQEKKKKDKAAPKAEGTTENATTTKSEDSTEDSTEKVELPPDPPSRDLKKEALVEVIDGKIPLIVRAHRMDDILRAIEIAEEFKIKVVINHGTEAYKVADELREANIPVLVGPINTQPDSFETLGAIYENAARLQKAGVLIAIQTGDTHNVRNLPYYAGLAVAHGLPRAEALRAVTVNPAKIFGLERYGSLEKGKIANVVVTDGDIFQPRTHVKKLYIRGKPVSLESKQTKLYEKFKPATPEPPR